MLFRSLALLLCFTKGDNAEVLRTVLPEIVGIVAFREAKQPREKSVSAAEQLFGTDYLTYQTQRFAYRVSAGSFFQTNRHLTDELVNIVTQEASGDLALDLYAGVGLFSTALARTSVASFP